jgi:hypothetical protein
MRKRAIDLCAGWVTERLNGEDGLGAIYPAMANSVMMYDALGYAPDHPHRAIARTSVDKLLVVKDDEAYCQPCVSPVWDTALAAHAMLEVGTPRPSNRPMPRSTGWVSGRSWTRWATGRNSAPMCARAAGRSSMAMIITPIWMTPPLS